jgi:hypothetical protein
VNRLDQPNVLCPSARLKEGAILLGIVCADGTVRFASERLAVNHEFVKNARQGRPAEKRFRFADNCVKAACKQWSGGRCSIVDQILDPCPVSEPQSTLPSCSIRTQCRWYFQRGADACGVCPLVVTDCLESTNVDS